MHCICVCMQTCIPIYYILRHLHIYTCIVNIFKTVHTTYIYTECLKEADDPLSAMLVVVGREGGMKEFLIVIGLHRALYS